MDPFIAGPSAPMIGFRVDDQSEFYQNIGNGFKFKEPIENPNFMDLPLLPPPCANSCVLPVAPRSAPMNGFRVDDQSDFYQNISNGFIFEEPIEDPYFVELPLPPTNENSCVLPVAPRSAPMNGFRVDDQTDFYQNFSNGFIFEEPIEDPNFVELPLPPTNENSCGLPVAPPSAPMNGFRVDDQTDFYQNISNGFIFEEPIEDPNFVELPLPPTNENSCGLPVAPPSAPMNGFGVDDQYYFYHNIGNGLNFEQPNADPNFKNLPLQPPNPNSCGLPVAPPSPEDYVFSDCVLKYINQVLMEEDTEERTCMFQEFSALQAAEKPFYEILGQKYPPPPFQESVEQFGRGVEEASKFLPNGKDLILDVEKRDVSSRREPKEKQRLPINVETKDKGEYSRTEGSKGRKHLHGDEAELEVVRSNKQSAVYTEAAEHTDMFDIVLLNHPGGKGESSLDIFRESLKNRASKSGGKSRGRKRGGKKELVDLNTLLMQCAQAIATEDRKTVNDLLKQIRQHSTPSGDGNQRLAHYFADAIEARLAGTGRPPFTSNSRFRKSAADILRAYHLYTAICPFKKVSHFFSSKNILNLVEKSTRLHIVDFGVSYGFQWPSFIQILSNRPGGPPKLRITGIEVPQPGFRPLSTVEETGRRLANYAKTFNVPFEYTAIAQKWETIQLEDLKIDRNEVLVVNCLFRLKNLPNETVVVESPRNAVLSLIRRMKPEVFIHGVVNGAYDAPYFETRFREVLFQYSAMFDMLEANVPREVHERMLIERDLLARGAINVISCEGSERVERPETYKQWQIRNLRAGLKQLPLNPDIIKAAREKVKAGFHKDFGIDQDSHWMLETWKGRILYAVSCWKSVYDS